MIKFKTRFVLQNGKHASLANMNRIVAVSTEVCKNVYHRNIDNKSYKERWVIKKEEKGYIFREVTHNGGISGHHKTIRRLVMRSCGFPHINIIIEDQP